MTKKSNKPYLISYEQKLLNALRKCKSISAKDRLWLYSELNKICYTQVADCADCITLAWLITIRELEGYGEKRCKRFVKRSQEILDEAVDKYDMATAYGLRQRFKEMTGVTFVLHTEGEE